MQQIGKAVPKFRRKGNPGMVRGNFWGTLQGGFRCSLELRRTGAILHVQAFPAAWTCRRLSARSSILWRLTCRRLSARSSVKSKGRAGGTLHVRRLKNKYIGSILWQFSQIRTKLGPNIRKASKMKLYVNWVHFCIKMTLFT